MPERILILTNNIGGLFSFRKEVVQAIVDSGYEVFISKPDSDERQSYFESIGCKLIDTPFNRRGKNPLADLKLLLAYLSIIRKVKPLAVLTYTIKPNVYGGLACRLTSTPQIANVTGLGDALENGGWLQKLTVVLYRIGLGKAKRVFFQNKANRTYCIAQRIADEKSVLLPGSGVNLSYHQFQEYPPDRITKFLFISRLIKDKGTEEFIQMAKAVKEQYPQTEFNVLGNAEGQYQQELEELVKEGIINYLGETIDVRPYLARVHCTILPSYHEGMSNVNLESAANGRPVITTDVPGCRETVDNDVTGFLVKAKDPQDLINGVNKFLSLSYEQKQSMAVAARRKVEREFDRNIVVKAYLEAIKSISGV